MPNDRWTPTGTRWLYQQLPAVGQLIAAQHRVWRVVEIRDRPVDLWTDDDRAALAAYGDHAVKPCVIVVDHAGGPHPDGRRRHVPFGGRRQELHVYPDEHWPACGRCGEPQPCRDKHTQRIAEQAMARMARYEIGGVCPRCGEPISIRQRSVTFTENLEVPGGPPVTFHTGRGGCRHGAAEYERRWVAADPNRRRVTLSCPGKVTNHNDGTYECTELAECRGPASIHDSYETCRCLDCHARGTFDCHPAPGATRTATWGDWP